MSATLVDFSQDPNKTETITATLPGNVQVAAIWSNDPLYIDQPAGTGVIDPFLRIQANGNESGYNFDSANIPGSPLDVKPGPWTTLVSVADLATFTIGGVDYVQLRLDINETNNSSLLSLDAFVLYGSDDATLNVFDPSTRTFTDGAATTVYDLDGGADRAVGLNYAFHSGSGESDLAVFVPKAALAGFDYLYLYSVFGTLNQTNPNEAGDWTSDDGFEEWYSLFGGNPGQLPGSIAATKYLDANGNHSIDPDEGVLTGWTFHFTGTDGDGGSIDTFITDGGAGDADGILNGTAVLAGLVGGAQVHVEEVQQPGYVQTVGGGGFTEEISAGENAAFAFANAVETPPPTFDFSKEVSLDVDASIDIGASSDVAIATEVSVAASVTVDPDIDGNTAVFAIDVEAVGGDGYTELNLFTLTTDTLSSITATGVSVLG